MTFTGQAAHAGSTPMRMRQDSLAAAARAALEIRESAISHGGVATVGRMQSMPGVITAVAGRPRCSSTSATSTRTSWRRCSPRRGGVPQRPPRSSTARVERARRLPRRRRRRSTRRWSSSRGRACRRPAAATGEPIPSGPLHDATEIGRVVPTAMIFAQSDPPISHAAIEDSPEQALRVAIEAYGRTVDARCSPERRNRAKGAA